MVGTVFGLPIGTIVVEPIPLCVSAALRYGSKVLDTSAANPSGARSGSVKHDRLDLSLALE